MKAPSIVVPDPIARRIVSVVIPVRNEAARISEVLDAVAGQTDVGAEIEIIVVDDGSSDNTVATARQAGAFVIESDEPQAEGNPARARNIGARQSRGDPIVFLDADCVPAQGWLAAIERAHSSGAAVVGGALDLPAGLGLIARCDYYCGCYFTHSGQPAGPVPHHPPNNLSVRRTAFLDSCGFSERAPLSYTNEERHWQAELRNKGLGIFFEPQATVFHYNRSGFGNLLRRSYRWGYTAIESKCETGSTRAAWVHSRPWLVVALAPVLPFMLTGHVIASWVRAGRLEPVLTIPIILSSRIAYVAGVVVGGVRWLIADGSLGSPSRPSPRWQ